MIVTAEVTEPGFDALRRDAECDVRQQSLIGEYFVDCELGSRDAPELPDGGRIPVEPDLVDDPAGPDQHRHAAALPRALPADHLASSAPASPAGPRT